MQEMAWTFKVVMEAGVMPAISLLGLLGNAGAICVLHHREVKLKKDFVEVLSALAGFDILFLLATFFLFTLPTWSEIYQRSAYPILVPFLYPATNTFMTASIYMTVAVAVNRYLEMSTIGGRGGCFFNIFNSGVVQSVIVFLCATAFNLPRWYEYEFKYRVDTTNVTLEDNVTVVEVNETVVDVDTTWLRQDDDYIRDYIVIANTMCVLIIPTAIMLASTFLLLRQMLGAPTSLTFTSEQERNRKKRNRSITIMLIGIIVLFVLCHMGEMIVSCYEIRQRLANTEEDGTSGDIDFPQWVRNLIVVNHILIVANSSLNFAIYCKDLVFRQCAKKVYSTFVKCGRDKYGSGSGSGTMITMVPSSRISAATKMTGRPAVIIEKQNNGTGGSPGAGVATASFSKAADAPKQSNSTNGETTETSVALASQTLLATEPTSSAGNGGPDVKAV